MTIVHGIDFKTIGDKVPAQIYEIGYCDVGVEARYVLFPVFWF